MPLPPGTRLGPYEIGTLLGGGAQGDVYAARDTRLDRDVAIKVLSEHYSHTVASLERLRREAKALAALSHPQICVLHDIGREGDTDFLVMERVEGETLAQRLTRGPIPIENVLRYGAQIADALSRAHRAGVVHRDLKPGNVMLTRSGVKLMDFGLASALRATKAGGIDPSATTRPADIEDPVTSEGMVVGTIPYMAPEQLEGTPPDGRVDIWALGCVLYEMATGVRAFDGETEPELVTAIMRDEPRAMSELAPLVPPALERAVRQCLARDPEERWQTAGDLRRELVWIAESGSRTGVPAPLVRRRKSRERFAWTVATACAVAAAAMISVVLRPKPQPKALVFDLAGPQHVRSGTSGGGVWGEDIPRISPDGRHLAWNMEDSLGVRRIWVRHLNSLEAVPLPGTQGAGLCFWSPDSRFIAYFAKEKLHKIDITGGSPITICDAPHALYGSWGSRGLIVFDSETGSSNIQIVPASGGRPSAVDVVNRAKEMSAAWPEFLPDGRHFLYIAFSPMNRRTASLRVASIDSEEPKTIGEVGSGVAYGSGHVLYMHGNVLMARKFDVGALEFTGSPFPVAENVARVKLKTFLYEFSVSSEGTLVYKSSTAKSRLVWFDRTGKELGTIGESARYRSPRLSPDGTRLAVCEARDAAATNTPGMPDGTFDVWTWDLPRNLGSRITFTETDALKPTWSPDGSRLAYSVQRGDSTDIYAKRVQGGTATLLYHSGHANYPSDWSPDGRSIAFEGVTSFPRSVDTYLLSLGDSIRSTPLLATVADEWAATFSPDGRWLAYVSNESGQYEIYARSFPDEGRKWRVSTSGGLDPHWRGDGKELFYRTPDGALMSVSVEPGPSPRFLEPRRLFSPRGGFETEDVPEYDVTRDGQRFLVVVAEGDPADLPTTVVVDWLGRLGKR